jgi:hypothetical protein
MLVGSYRCCSLGLLLGVKYQFFTARHQRFRVIGHTIYGIANTLKGCGKQKTLQTNHKYYNELRNLKIERR